MKHYVRGRVASGSPLEQDELVFSTSSSDSLRAAPLAYDCALKSSTLKLSFLFSPPLNMERSQSR